MSHYETMGVSRDASADEIRAAYKSLAQKYHPDKADGDTQKFQAVQAAYAVLSDEASREEYDQSGAAWTEPEKVLFTALVMAIDGAVSGSRISGLKSSAMGMLQAELDKARNILNNAQRAGPAYDKLEGRVSGALFQEALRRRKAVAASAKEEYSEKIQHLMQAMEILRGLDEEEIGRRWSLDNRV